MFQDLRSQLSQPKVARGSFEKAGTKLILEFPRSDG